MDHGRMGFLLVEGAERTSSQAAHGPSGPGRSPPACCLPAVGHPSVPGYDANVSSGKGGHVSQNGRSGWATGAIYFAGAMLILIGLFDFFMGLAAIIDDKFFVPLPNYFITLDVTAWGWIHVVLGVVVAAAGLGVFVGGPGPAWWGSSSPGSRRWRTSCSSRTTRSGRS